MGKNYKINDEQKLKLMTEFIQETGQKIKSKTQYKGYNIGAMQANLRQNYFNGTLKIDENLLQQFIEMGIIKRERASRTTQLRKYQFLMSLKDKDKEQLSDIKMENGSSYRNVRNQMQLYYSRKNMKLTDDQINDLIRNGIINLTQEEKREVAENTKIPKQYLSRIMREYGSLENFVDKLKKRETDYPFEKRIFCGFRGVVLSEKEITQKQKLNYAKLVQKILGNNFYKSGMYIDIDKIDEVINTLMDNEKTIIRANFGLDKNSSKLTHEKIAEKMNRSSARIGQIKTRAIKKLSQSKKISECLVNLDIIKQEYENRCKDIQESIDSINILKSNIICENGKFGELSKEEKSMLISYMKLCGNSILDNSIPIEQLQLSKRSYNCIKRNGINTLNELMQKTEGELMQIRAFGEKSKKEIIEKLRHIGRRLRYEGEKQNVEQGKIKISFSVNDIDIILEECKKELEQCKRDFLQDERIVRYNIALANYLNKENLFDENSIVPAVPKKRKENDTIDTISNSIGTETNSDFEQQASAKNDTELLGQQNEKDNSTKNSTENLSQKKEQLLESIKNHQKELSELEKMIDDKEK